MRPFIIFALPRSGTTMLCNALESHPEIKQVIHEFRGDEAWYWKYPAILSNYVKDWMLSDDITRIHVYREDAIAGARSMLLMNYIFLDGVVTLPANEVEKLAEQRKAWDAEFAEQADYSISYEELCGGKEATTLHGSRRLCDWIDIPYRPLVTDRRKGKRLVLKNEEEIECLRAAV